MWNYGKADWNLLQDLCEEEDWEFLRQVDTDDGAARLTKAILKLADNEIGRKTLTELKSTHPWLTDDIIESERRKKMRKE